MSHQMKLYDFMLHQLKPREITADLHKGLCGKKQCFFSLQLLLMFDWLIKQIYLKNHQTLTFYSL